MMPKLVIENLTKQYGTFKAVDDLSFEVEAGCIFGLLGRNGAGKTTTFSCALGLARPTRGRVWFDGEPLTMSQLHNITYVPEVPALYGWMTVREHLEMQRSVYPRFDVAYANALVALFELPLRKRVRSLSKGQKTATALTLAFAQRADVMFLDEPSTGLDPIMQRRLLDLIVQAGNDGTTIIFSSHHIGQIERAAEHIAIIDRGRLALQSNLEALRDSRKIVEAFFPDAPQIDALRRHAGVDDIELRGNLMQVRTRAGVTDIVAAIESLHPTSLRVLDQTLEDVFLTTIDAVPLAVK
jgi:ABC-2 type transport system ATP-binding protein